MAVATLRKLVIWGNLKVVNYTEKMVVTKSLNPKVHL